MENISLSIINLRTNKETAMAASQVYINKSPDFQRCYEAWDDKLRTRFIESMLLNRATNPIWTVLNDNEESEEILDGMHRITTALSFLNNEFSINKNYLLTLNEDIYHKKKFQDLPSDDKSRIRNYNFIFNKLDSSYRNDKNKLRDMYEILNRSSKTLTDYEFNKVILMPFYEIISKHKQNIILLDFFQKKDQRGNIDVEIIEMLILSYELPNCWSSIANLTDDWIKNNIGQTNESVTQFVKDNSVDIENRLTLIYKITKDFNTNNLISDDKKTFKKYYLIYKFIISRCCYLIKSYPLFNRNSNNLKILFEEFLSDSPLIKVNRNATFQKNVIINIDKLINDTLSKDTTTRFFTKKQISEKLSTQNNICPLCKLVIKETDEYEGDHIISWCSGGSTTLDNLQVLHKRCHQKK
jgi:hypothetical protein